MSRVNKILQVTKSMSNPILKTKGAPGVEYIILDIWIKFNRYKSAIAKKVFKNEIPSSFNVFYRSVKTLFLFSKKIGIHLERF